MLGVRAALGRTFSGGDTSGAADVVVLSDELWRRRFGADPGIIGRTIDLTLGRRDPDYFSVMRIPLRVGRLFDTNDTALTPPVAIVSERLARAMFPGETAVGTRPEHA